MKTKIKTYSDEASDFNDKELPMGSNQTCLTVITTDSVLKKYQNYYPQAFLKECKSLDTEEKKWLDILVRI